MEHDMEKDIRELKEQVRRNTVILERNHKILKKMHSSMRTKAFFSLVYWILIIGSMFGLYYYFQPIIKSIQATYQELILLPDKLKSF